MAKTISPRDMKQLETEYMAKTGAPGILLMEHAAQAVCRELLKYSNMGTVLFVVGPGNNGGDGYAAARIWKQMGGKPVVWEISYTSGGDAGINRQLAYEMEIDINFVYDFLPPVYGVDAIVDALFGTGLSRGMSGTAASLAKIMNSVGVPIVSVDIPSGLDGTTGRVLGECVKADVTVTFHRIKDGLLLRNGPDYAGKIVTAPILIPENEGDFPGMEYIDREDIEKMIPARNATDHKGTFGRCVIFAGSMGMAGAASFCASACVKAGAGLTTILCRESILPILQTLCPAAMCVPLREKNGRIVPSSAETAARELEKADAACVGCGLGKGDDLLPVLFEFARCQCPVVWDADGLNAIAENSRLMQNVCGKKNNIFTPHPGEAARLMNVPLGEILENPVESLTKLQKTLGGTVLLKGARTLMTDGSKMAVNIYGTAALGKGGSGDVLSGILTALAARNMPNVSMLGKTQLAVLIHAMAGIRCEKITGENCLTPQLLLESIRLDSKE